MPKLIKGTPNITQIIIIMMTPMNMLFKEMANNTKRSKKHLKNQKTVCKRTLIIKLYTTQSIGMMKISMKCQDFKIVKLSRKKKFELLSK